MTARRAPTPRFVVEITSTDADRKPTRQQVSTHAVESASLRAICAIIQQWAAMEGAVTAGTTVSIVDTTDGGVLFSAKYLGYEPNTLGGKRTWQALASRQQTRQPWPR